PPPARAVRAPAVPHHTRRLRAVSSPRHHPQRAHGPAPRRWQRHGRNTGVHTDDAATKLSDRVRRRCFNCCTTDTSTWRRSNLSPGKVLCNKCGLFERTHSRPRPEQFPHKRGPLASSTLRSRSPPQAQVVLFLFSCPSSRRPLPPFLPFFLHFFGQSVDFLFGNSWPH
ncbi:hypothetical protein B0H13DRAFT_2192562, partial [Mycena leptocephala]